MSILDFFGEFKVTVTISRPSIVKTDGKVRKSYTEVGNVTGLFWDGSASQPFVDDRFKDKTPSFFSAPYNADIQENDKLTYNGRDYHCLNPDSIPLGSMQSDGHKYIALAVFS